MAEYDPMYPEYQPKSPEYDPESPEYNPMYYDPESPTDYEPGPESMEYDPESPEWTAPEERWATPLPTVPEARWATPLLTKAIDSLYKIMIENPKAFRSLGIGGSNAVAQRSSGAVGNAGIELYEIDLLYKCMVASR